MVPPVIGASLLIMHTHTGSPETTSALAASTITMPDPTYPPPVFVLAPPGLPGQTLAAALGAGPVSYGLPELNLEQMDSVEVLQRELIGIRAPQLHGLMRAVAELYSGEQTAAAVEMAGRWMMRRSYMATRDVAREIAAHIAPRRMIAPVTASLFDRASLARLTKAFPEATYVHLHMHPHTYGRQMAADSSGLVAVQLSGAVDETTEPPTPDPQKLWLMAEQAMEAFLETIPERQAIAVQVESFLADPEAGLRELAILLGLPYDEPAMAAMLAPERSVFAGPGPMGAHMPSAIRSFATHAAHLPDPAEARLIGPVPWREDEIGLSYQLRKFARAKGYR